MPVPASPKPTATTTVRGSRRIAGGTVSTGTRAARAMPIGVSPRTTRSTTP